MAWFRQNHSAGSRIGGKSHGGALLLALLLICATTALWGQEPCAVAQPDVTTRVDEFVRQEMERQSIPDVALAVVQRGEVLVAKGYGLANVEHQFPVGPHTIVQSGSVGKQFTAAAVLVLVEEGKLALDESIATYLPDAPAEWRPITVRHLLTPTSGIPEYTTEAFDYRRDYSEQDLLKLAYGKKRNSRRARDGTTATPAMSCGGSS